MIQVTLNNSDSVSTWKDKEKWRLVIRYLEATVMNTSPIEIGRSTVVSDAEVTSIQRKIKAIWSFEVEIPAGKVLKSGHGRHMK